MNKYKKKIKNFIRETIDDYDIERTEFDSWDFKSINELYKLNDKMVDTCDDALILWLAYLIKLIKQEKINNMDKESMVEFTTSGFCWNKNKELVLFNER